MTQKQRKGDMKRKKPVTSRVLERKKGQSEVYIKELSMNENAYTQTTMS